MISKIKAFEIQEKYPGPVKKMSRRPTGLTRTPGLSRPTPTTESSRPTLSTGLSRTTRTTSSPATGEGQVTASGLPRLTTERTLPVRSTPLNPRGGPLYQQRVVPDVNPLARVNIQDVIEGPTTYPVTPATGVVLWVNTQDEFGIDAAYQIGSHYFDARDLIPRESVSDNFRSAPVDLTVITSTPVLLQSSDDWGVYYTSINSSGETILNALVDINESDDLKDVVVLSVPDLSQNYSGEGNYPENTNLPPFDPEWLTRVVNLSEQELPLNEPRSLEEINAEVEISIGEDVLPPPLSSVSPESGEEIPEFEEEVVFEQEPSELIIVQRPGSYPSVVRTSDPQIENRPSRATIASRIQGRPAPPGIPSRTMGDIASAGPAQRGTVGRINPAEDQPYTGSSQMGTVDRGLSGESGPLRSMSGSSQERPLNPHAMSPRATPSSSIPSLNPGSSLRGVIPLPRMSTPPSISPIIQQRVLVPVQQDPLHTLYDEPVHRRNPYSDPPVSSRIPYIPPITVQQPVPRDTVDIHHERMEQPLNTIELRLWLQEGELTSAYFDGSYYDAQSLEPVDVNPEIFLQIFLRRDELTSTPLLVETPDFIGLYMSNDNQLLELIPVPVDSPVTSINRLAFPRESDLGEHDPTLPRFSDNLFSEFDNVDDIDITILNNTELMSALRSSPHNQVIFMDRYVEPESNDGESESEGMLTPPLTSDQIVSRLVRNREQFTPTGMHYRSGSPRLDQPLTRGYPRVVPTNVYGEEAIYEEVTITRQVRSGDIPQLSEVRRISYDPPSNVQGPVEVQLIEGERDIVEQPEGVQELRLFIGEDGRVEVLYYTDGTYYNTSYGIALPPRGYFVQVFLRPEDLASVPLLIETENFVGIYTMTTQPQPSGIGGELRGIIPVPVDEHIIQVVNLRFLSSDQALLPPFNPSVHTLLSSAEDRGDSLEDIPEFMRALRANPRNQVLYTTQVEPFTPIQTGQLSPGQEQPRYRMGQQERESFDMPVTPVVRPAGGVTVPRISAVAPPSVRRVLFPSDQYLTPSPFSSLPPYPASSIVPQPERATSPPLTQRSFEAYLQQVYGIPLELPDRLPIPGLGRLHGEFISFERATELLTNNRITNYTVDPLLQPWAGPPGGPNRIVTLLADNGMTYLVKAQYDFESGQIFPPA